MVKLLARLNRELLYYPQCLHRRWHPQMLKFSLKFLRPHYFLNLSLIWFIFGMMIHTGPKFCAVPSPPTRSYQGQGQRLRIFMLESCWRQCSVHECLVLHCTEPVIIFSLSWYDLNKVERDINHKFMKYACMMIWTKLWQVLSSERLKVLILKSCNFFSFIYDIEYFIIEKIYFE